MISKAITRVFGSKHDRDLKRLQPLVDAINALEPELESLSDDQLRARTGEARSRLDQGADLDDLLAPAFATVARPRGAPWGCGTTTSSCWAASCFTRGRSPR